MSRNASRFGRSQRTKNWVGEPRLFDYRRHDSYLRYLRLCYPSRDLQLECYNSCYESRHDIYVVSKSEVKQTLSGPVVTHDTINIGEIPYEVEEYLRDNMLQIKGDYVLVGSQWTKIGKYLGRKAPDLLQIWEKRTPTKKYTWVLSSCVDDVLNMSMDQCWTSCMRPGGIYETGPVYSALAGDVVIYWYELGAKRPCGRFLVRNCGKGRFYPEPRLYGYGPGVSFVFNILDNLGILADNYLPVCTHGYSDTYGSCL